MCQFKECSPRNIFLHSPRVEDKEGNLLTEEEALRERWKQHFEEVLNRPNPPTTLQTTEPEEIETIRTGPITEAEIRKAIQALKNSKAPGIDAITAELLKADLPTTLTSLKNLFLHIWDKEEVPSQWNKGLIAKVPKKGDLTNCSCWRGITLMSVPAKVMGKVIANRIREGIDRKLRQEQAGFRSGHGTTEHIHTLRTIVEQANEWNANLYSCFMDYEKAFDSFL